MAESVDALVSNTSGATHAGSIPALGTTWLRIEGFAATIFCGKTKILYVITDKEKLNFLV